jgi:hypothetical protein
MSRDAGPLARPFPQPTEGRDPASTDRSEPTSDATQPLPACRAVRLGHAQLTQLAERMPDRERALVKTVSRLRLVRSDQLQRLHYHEITSPRGRARICRRSLQLLADQGVLRRVERRVGGNADGGSSGYVYTLAPAGRRVMAYWNGKGIASDRGVHEPGMGFVEHTLAVSELYVRLAEAARMQPIDLLAFNPEPECWRTFTGPTGAQIVLKPDALVQIGAGDEELRWWIEADMGTHSRGAITRKLNSYMAYWRTGREQAETGLFPRVAFVTTTNTRAEFLETLIDQLPHAAQRLFAVTTTADAIDLLLGTEDIP